MAPSDEPRDLDAIMLRRLRLARAALLWERLWPVLWPPLGVAGVFLALALFDVLPLLPGWLHAAVLAGAVIASALLLGRGLLGLRLPTEREARHRLERDNALRHHPLDTLSDRLPDGSGDAAARTLWQAHQRRMAAMVRRLRIGWPSPGLPARDPWGLRAGVLLLLVIAAAGSWHADPWGRIARAFSPALTGPGVSPAQVQLWLTPPEYTGQAPVYLQAPAEAPPPERLRVPFGTRILATLQGGSGEAVLAIAGGSMPFDRLGDESWRVEAKLQKGGTLKVRQGLGTVASWDIEVLPDAPPHIALLGAKRDERGRLRLDYEARDDFGLRSLWVHIERPQAEGALPVAKEEKRLSLPVPSADQSRRASWHDLTAHPWAGLPVTLTPEASDGAGQLGRGEALSVVLPERQFTHPVAREIVALRRELARDPSMREVVVSGLDDVSARPQRFDHDRVVYLALRVARARLVHDVSVRGLVQVRDILWDTALRLEEGDAGVAERALAQAQRDLREALENDASPEEIERLMDRLQQALNDYMRALAEQMARQGLQPTPMPEGAQAVTPQELSEMVERMREMARLGSTEAAKQMLSQLEEMLRGMQPGMQGQMSQEMQQAQEALSDVQELARQQRELLDRTFRQQGQEGEQQGQRQGQQGEQGQQGRQGQQQGLGQMAEDQEDLRRRLGDAMRRLGESLGEIPQSLGQAEQAMRDATRSLRQGEAGEAAGAQTEALRHLQQGARAAMREMSRQMAGQGMPMPMPGAMGNGGRDPLGRTLRGRGFDDRSVDIPEEQELHRAHEILEELRRRSGETRRPVDEREYIHRLLERFY